jgi:hypothetical protein
MKCDMCRDRMPTVVLATLPADVHLRGHWELCKNEVGVLHAFDERAWQHWKELDDINWSAVSA